jgi:Undecaprenyl-phosphate galactose phosphotransferase WbaP
MRELTKLVKGIFRTFCLVIIDLIAFYTALLAAWTLRAKVLPAVMPDLPVLNFSYFYFVSLWWIPSVFIFFIFYESLYDSNLPFWDETKVVVKAVSLASITLLAIVTLGKMGDMVSRLVLSGMWIVSLFVFPIFRFWGKRCLYAACIQRERVLIIGAGNAGRLVLEGLEREKHMGYEVIGFLDDDKQKIGRAICEKKIFGSVEEFPRFVQDLGVRTVIIAIPSLTPERLSVLTASVQNHTVNTMVIPDLKGIALLNTALFHLFAEEIFLLHLRNNLKSVTNRFIKRLFDMALGIVFALILIPLIAFFGIIIRLETPGSAIYAHDRIGRNGKIFRCYKFRTMRRDAEEKLKEMLGGSETLRTEWENTWKLRDDPRVTKIGRFLRKSSLDELPQIFNVIKGEMSLVGPRPYLPREKSEIKDNFRVISSAKPGITGLWQVSGRSNVNCKYRVKLDAWYVMNWSLWLDIAILFRTIKVVLRAEGAY